MDPIKELLEFDSENVSAAKAVEERIQQEGLAAGHTISDVRVYRVLMPWVGTKRWDGSAEGFTFAEFETDKGLIGIAEGANSDLDELRAKVLGKNPFDTSIRAEMGLAYWDLSGKIADRPLGRHLHELFALETPLAERVPMSAYTWYSFPDINGENAVTFESYPEYVQGIIREHGFHNIKLSMCDFEPHRYIELVRNVRQAVGPDVDIRVDPHASWGEAQALRFMRGVEDCHIEWIEEPVGGRFDHVFRAGHRLRRLSPIPISSHAWLPPVVKQADDRGRYGDGTLHAALDADALRRYQPADISAPDAYAGPLALKRYYDAARFMGLGIGMHSAYELGPATAIRLHIAAFAFPYEMPYHIVWGRDRAFPPFSAHPLDAHYNQWEGDVIQGGKMIYDQGFLMVPTGPGLGVVLDHERLAHYAHTKEKAAMHTRHIEAIRATHLDALDWKVERGGWRRYKAE